jgi:hypothetical protein
VQQVAQMDRFPARVVKRCIQGNLRAEFLIETDALVKVGRGADVGGYCRKACIRDEQ